ncbi:hypothetical protein ACLB2K_000321 [Fragaria x ananassa]
MQQTLVSSFCFILLAFSSIVLGKKPNCGKHGPVIKFPFSFKGSHPENPGFLVSCNEKKETILELPIPVKFAIKTIDYKAQKIQLYDPEDCLLAKLLKVHNMSMFPFHYSENQMIDITLFNCSSAERESPTSLLNLVPCFGYQIYWVYSSYNIEVYSYGMALLEMVGGRKNISSTTANTPEVYYPEWIYNLLEEGEDLRIHVGEEADAKIAKRLAIVGLWCIQWHPVDRPSMKGVVQMLEGGENLTMPPNPFASQGPAGTSASTPAKRLNLQLEPIAELE